MTAPRACRHCLVLGLIFSAVLHGAVARLWPRAPEPPSAAPLVLELAWFDPAPRASASALPAPPEPAEPPPAPAPPPAPERADLPSAPPAEPPPRPKPRTERPKLKAEPKPLPVKRVTPRRAAPELRPAAAPPKPPPRPPAAPPVPAPPTFSTVAAARSPAKPATAAGAVPATRPRVAAPVRPPAPPPRPGESASAYLAEVQRAVARGQVYPEEARRARKTGTAVVAFVIQSNGAITGVRLARSSGDAGLDRAALATVGRVGRVRPIPAAAGRSTWALQVPIRFALR